MQLMQLMQLQVLCVNSQHDQIISPHLDDPPVVDILEGVTGDLLLVTRSSTIGIFQRIHLFMRVQPTWWLTKRVTQRDLRPVFDERRLTLDDGRQASVQRRLRMGGGILRTRVKDTSGDRPV